MLGLRVRLNVDGNVDDDDDVVVKGRSERTYPSTMAGGRPSWSERKRSRISVTPHTLHRIIILFLLLALPIVD